MENTVTISPAAGQRLDGRDRQSAEKLNAAAQERTDAERAFVARARDEHDRRNDRLEAENRRLHDSAAETSGTNVKLRLGLGKAEKRIADLEGAVRVAGAAVDVAKEEAGKRNETEKTLREEIDDLREEIGDLIIRRDALLGRGLWSRILSRR